MILIETLRVILVEVLKKRITIERGSVFLEFIYVVMVRMVAEMWRVKATPVRSQMEKTNTENWKKGHSCYKEAWNLADLCLCPQTL